MKDRTRQNLVDELRQMAQKNPKEGMRGMASYILRHGLGEKVFP